jgi:hypothetical protein
MGNSNSTQNAHKYDTVSTISDDDTAKKAALARMQKSLSEVEYDITKMNEEIIKDESSYTSQQVAAVNNSKKDILRAIKLLQDPDVTFKDYQMQMIRNNPQTQAKTPVVMPDSIDSYDALGGYKKSKRSRRCKKSKKSKSKKHKKSKSRS